MTVFVIHRENRDFCCYNFKIYGDSHVSHGRRIARPGIDYAR
jgi:hypothetical protein